MVARWLARAGFLLAFGALLAGLVAGHGGMAAASAVVMLLAAVMAWED